MKTLPFISMNKQYYKVSFSDQSDMKLQGQLTFSGDSQINQETLKQRLKLKATRTGSRVKQEAVSVKEEGRKHSFHLTASIKEKSNITLFYLTVEDDGIKHHLQGLSLLRLKEQSFST